MLDVPADADPREFLVDVAMSDKNQPLNLDVFYFACDDALTFCIPVNQSYRIYLQRDNHGRTIRTGRKQRAHGGAESTRASFTNKPDVSRRSSRDLRGGGVLIP